MTISELIEKLEKATGPDRELDAEIAVLITKSARMPSADDRFEKCEAGTFWVRSAHGLSLHDAAPYTASLDAAMTLVPHVEPRTHWHLRCYPHGCYSAIVSDAYPVGTHYGGQHMTSPAIALCIAALKARTA